MVIRNQNQILTSVTVICNQKTIFVIDNSYSKPEYVRIDILHKLHFLHNLFKIH